MPVTTRKLSLITPTYNGLRVLRACVESIQKHCSGVDWEWIIGENGSTDGSLEYLKSLNDPRIVIVERRNEGNFSTMNNDLVRSVSIFFFSTTTPKLLPTSSPQCFG